MRWAEALQPLGDQQPQDRAGAGEQAGRREAAAERGEGGDAATLLLEVRESGAALSEPAITIAPTTESARTIPAAQMRPRASSSYHSRVARFMA